MKSHLTIAAAIVLIVAGSAQATDWPTYRQNLDRTAYTPDSPAAPYEPKWARADLQAENIVCWSEPIVADGRVYVGTVAGNVYALDRDTGKTLWKRPVGSGVMHSVAYHDGLVFLGVHGGWSGAFVTALDAATGEQKWKTPTPQGGFWTSPAISDSLVMLGDRAGVFYAFDEKSGGIKWTYKTGGPILTSAAVRDGKAYFASEDMYAYCLNVADGSLAWTSRKLDGRTFRGYCPVLWNDQVVLRTGTTIVYAAYEVEGQLMLNGWVGWGQNYQGLTRGGDDKGVNPILGVTYGEIREKGKWSFYTPQRVNEESQAFREKLRGRPALRTGFLLAQADGVERLSLPVCYASGCACTPVPATVDGEGNLYVLFKSYYSQWDVPIRAHDAVGRYNPESETIELVRYTDPEDPAKNRMHTYFHLTADETNNLSVAGNVLWNQHGTNGSRGWYVGAMDLTTGKFVYGCGGEGVKYPMAFGLPNKAYDAGSSGQVGATVISDGQVFNLVSGVLTCIGPKTGAAVQNHADKPHAPATEKPAAPANQNLTLDNVIGESLAPGKGADAAGVSKRLAAEVATLIDGGPWAPLRATGGMADHGFWGGENQFYFCLPSETFAALARAYPYLGPALQARVKDYLAAEWKRFKPWTDSIYDPGPNEGKLYGVSVGELTRREPYNLGYWLYGPVVRYSGVGNAMGIGDLSPVAGYYGIWLYANNLDQWPAVRAAWPEMKTHFAAFVDGKAGHGQRIEALNWHLSGLIGYARIAKHLGDETEYAKVAARLQALVGTRVDREKGNAQSVYRGTYDQMAPELWRYLASAVGEAMNDRLARDLDGVGDYPKGAQLFYAWGVGPHETRNGESSLVACGSVYAAFMAKAFAYNTPAERLREQYLDLPWCPADLYYIEKLATVLDLADGAKWKPVK